MSKSGMINCDNVYVKVHLCALVHTIYLQMMTFEYSENQS